MADDGGIGRLQARLAAIPKNVKAAVQPALVKQGEAMAGTMRSFAPVDTGKLRDSIAVTPPDASTPAYSTPGGRMIVPETSVAITAGNSDVRYAHLVEYGTVKAEAEPYFWPAVRLHNKKAKQAIKRAISTAVKKEWGK
ncbi:HK97-gp10 family putative phage morphogenesis protein [Mesorhizobium sp. PUT5]|uniref:HK97-gp10 family putative phage morphogenesis protein n=1 Tax=Mesorhizobium sp. PUT5 TaxID=3454629 RepID=UPI003FA473A9